MNAFNEPDSKTSREMLSPLKDETSIACDSKATTT